jgi:hypothetical protein
MPPGNVALPPFVCWVVVIKVHPLGTVTVKLRGRAEIVAMSACPATVPAGFGIVKVPAVMFVGKASFAPLDAPV